MQLSTKRRNEIAWLYLVSQIRQRPVDNVSVEKLHAEICTIVPSEHSIHSCCWDFVNDITDTVFFEVRNRDSAVSYRINEDQRCSWSYDVLLQIMLYEGVCIKSTTRLEMEEFVANNKVTRSEAFSFFDTIVTKILNKVMK